MFKLFHIPQTARLLNNKISLNFTIPEFDSLYRNLMDKKNKNYTINNTSSTRFIAQTFFTSNYTEY